MYPVSRFNVELAGKSSTHGFVDLQCVSEGVTLVFVDNPFVFCEFLEPHLVELAKGRRELLENGSFVATDTGGCELESSARKEPDHHTRHAGNLLVDVSHLLVEGNV